MIYSRSILVLYQCSRKFTITNRKGMINDQIGRGSNSSNSKNIVEREGNLNENAIKITKLHNDCSLSIKNNNNSGRHEWQELARYQDVL